MRELDGEGLRPWAGTSHAESCDCWRVCPVAVSEYPEPLQAGEVESHARWGRILELWEGHALDEEVRWRGASGGVLTALSLYCLEVLGMSGVLHLGPDPGDPTRNRTFLSTSRAELLARTGSRYAPGAVCERLDLVEKADRPCVIIGRPVEIAAVCRARKLRPGLGAKVGVTLSFFCAESPSRKGTLELLRKHGIDPAEVAEIRYRGNGWPGEFTVRLKGGEEPTLRLSYRESWGFLQAYRPWGAHLWPDGTGELADISCGDPWYETPDGRNPGFSLVVVRTELGRRIVHGAMESGYVRLVPAEQWKLEKAQWGLVLKKGSIWGRRLAMRMCGLPVTKFEGLDLYRCWKLLPLGDKFKSLLGTLRRIAVRKLYKPLDLSQMNHAGSENSKSTGTCCRSP